MNTLLSISLIEAHLQSICRTWQLMVVEMETSVEIINATSQLICIRFYSEQEWLGVGDDGLLESLHTQGIPTESI